MVRAVLLAATLALAAAMTGCAQTEKMMTDVGMRTPDLTKALVSKLGVTEAQATGGVGAMMQSAKEKLSGADWEKVSESVPGVDRYLKSAQEMLGGKKLSEIGGVKGAFKKLGMAPDMVAKFKPVVLDYAGQHGGDSVKSMLAKVL